MELKEFDQEQKMALLELMVLAMYVDGHLASSEDEKIKRLAKSVAGDNGYERNLLVDQTFTKMSRIATDPVARDKYVRESVALFPGHEEKGRALQALTEMVRSDLSVSEEEHVFLATVREQLTGAARSGH